MKTLHASALALLASGAIALLGGCDSEPDSHVVSAPPPGTPGQTSTVVTTQTTTAPVTQTVAVPVQQQTTYTTTQGQPANTVIVTNAPPAAQAEVVSARPGSDYVWVSGYWTWRDNRYEWMAGHWEVPPRTDSVWVPPHWVPENGAYRFYEGYWN